MAETKRCTECGEMKPVSEFYRDARARDGLRSLCKACDVARVVKWERENKDRIRPRKRAKERRYYERHRDRITAYRKRYHRENPEKKRARWVVKAAIKDGRLVRPITCERCGRTCKPDAHHADYAKQLEVEWLCKRCHRTHHAEAAAA